MSYRRVIISGTLTTCSELHIGTGDEAEYLRPTADNKEASFSYNTLLLDVEGKPYIPASTLRGYLRYQVVDANHHAYLFGEGRQASEADAWGQAGVVRVHDARLAQSGGKRRKVSRTSIDAVTGTAKRHHLSTHEVVPVNARFAVEIALDGFKGAPVQQDDITALLTALQTFGKEHNGQLGKGKSTGQGCLIWEPVSVLGLSEEDFIAWVNRPNQTPLQASFKPVSIEELAGVSVAGVRQGEWTAETFRLSPESPILINNPHDPAVLEKFTTEDQDRRKQLPNHAFMTRGQGSGADSGFHPQGLVPRPLPPHFADADAGYWQPRH